MLGMKELSKLTYGFKFKILGAFSLVALLSLGIVGTAFWSMERLAEMDVLKGHIVNVNFLLFHAKTSQKDLINQYALAEQTLDVNNNKILRRYDKATNISLSLIDSIGLSDSYKSIATSYKLEGLKNIIHDHRMIYEELVAKIVEIQQLKKDSVSPMALSIIENQIGVNHNDGIIQRLDNKFKEIEPVVQNFTLKIEERNEELKKESVRLLLGVFLFELILGFYLAYSFGNSIVKIVIQIRDSLAKLSKGEIPVRIKVDCRDELSETILAINGVVENIEKSAEFAENIGEGKFDESFSVSSERDKLGNALINMRDRLKAVSDEDQKRNWVIKGLAQFADLLRKNNEDTEELSRALIKELVVYMSANQGAVYIAEEKEEGVVLVQTAVYAWDKHKMQEKIVKVGQGMVGQCFVEEQRIYVTDIPNNYVNITSGLGKANPNAIIIIPLIVNEKCFGVFELASFKKFTDFEINFLEDLSESIAATISSVRTAENTKVLLVESEELTTQMREAEEEMRQNAEELTATMEENEEQNRRLIEEIKVLKDQMS